MADTVLIVGGYGVFGGRLAKRLIACGDFEVIVAGRDLAKAQSFCRKHGGAPLQLDLTGSFKSILERLAPFAVIDAAGPFQTYRENPYRVAEAAIAAGAHYLDLSDDAEFTAGIARLDDIARQAGVVVISGCSTVPAISLAIVDDLSHDMQRVIAIESFITPGNRAPRGRSVIAAILSQTGLAMRVWRDRGWQDEIGWGRVRKIAVSVTGGPALGCRLASPIGAPDLRLFPGRYNAESVQFFAGLEVGAMHRGLWLAGKPVRWRWSASLAPLAGAFQAAANLLYLLGSNRGGMRVDVVGEASEGRRVRRTWSLVAEGGHGPEIPATPAWALVRKLLKRQIEPGARPAVGVLSRHDVETALSPYDIATGVTEVDAQPLFQAAFSDAWADLPPSHRDLHDVADMRVFHGRASAERGRNPVAWLVSHCLGLPPTSEDVSVRVTMTRSEDREIWQRQFGDAVFRSTLGQRDADGGLEERFGLLTFDLRLRRDGRQFHFDFEGARLPGGIPMPRSLGSLSDTYDFVDPATGRPGFSVRVSLPLFGLLFAHRGTLAPARGRVTAGR